MRLPPGSRKNKNALLLYNELLLTISHMTKTDFIQSSLKRLATGSPLSESETYQIFEAMLAGDDAMSEAQIGTYLSLTAQRLLSADELVGAARSLREHALPVKTSSLPKGAIVIDTCGTGGSGKDSFNTSTAVAFVAAAAGLYVAKHGNRAATSRSGSADVLEALGVRLDLTAEQLARCLEETHFCFMFAPRHHPATKRVQAIRKQLGFRTIFNFLGPLANPAGVTHQLLGVSAPEMVTIMAEALERLGITSAAVVCGDDNLDEFTLTAETAVCEVRKGKLLPYKVSPEEIGLRRVPFAEICGFAAAEAAQKIRDILNGGNGAHRDLVAANAGAALFVAGIVNTIETGVAQALTILNSGTALQVLERVIEVTNRVH